MMPSGCCNYEAFTLPSHTADMILRKFDSATYITKICCGLQTYYGTGIGAIKLILVLLSFYDHESDALL